MTEIAFYHIQKASLEKVFLTLLKKSFDSGKRALVLVDSEERLRSLDQLLWNYNPNSWLPHGSKYDKNPEEQPIFLSCDDENFNNAQFLFLLDSMMSSQIGEYEKCFEIFDGRSTGAVSAARERWMTYKKIGYKLVYWQQNKEGSWEEKV